MSTKAQTVRAETERRNSKTSIAEKRRALRRKLALRTKQPTSQESAHAGRKATYAREEHAPGTSPSRKSSRKAANRMRDSSTLEIRAEAAHNAPSAVAKRAVAKRSHVRGH